MEPPNSIVLEEFPPANTATIAAAPFAGVADRSADIEEPLTVQNEFSLPPTDRGTRAWLFLTSAFVIEALTWGFPFSYGVFQEYYTTHEPFSSEQSGIAIIGTTSLGVLYMSGLALFPAYKKWSRLALVSRWTGIPIMALGLITASFATKTSHLIVTQGVLYGLGGSILYNPTIMFVDEWFVRRKGLAYGILWAGTSLSGLIVPFLLNYLLEKYGFRTCLRVWAICLIVLSTPWIYFIRPRLPITSVSQNPRYSISFIKLRSFQILMVCLIIESIGYFVPSLYLPLFTRNVLGLPSSSGSLLVALLNAATVFASITMGMLCDHFHVTTVVMLSTLGAVTSVFLLWGLATTLPVLCIFSLVYGFFAGGFVTTTAGIVSIVKQADPASDVGVLFGLMLAARGIGSLVAGPASEALLRGAGGAGVIGGGVEMAEAAYKTPYRSLVVFTGVTAALGGVSFLCRRLGWL